MDTKPEKQKPLSEEDFIQNGKFYKSWPFWLWPFLIATLLLLIMGTANIYKSYIHREEKRDPFLQVTNREFSVFLWQFPNFLRNNMAKKTGYLTGFSSTQENFLPEKGDEYVTAPPDLLFLYHTWNRLLAPKSVSTNISEKEFSEFLEQLPEWKPYAKDKFSELPLMVRLAFQGWKNYYKEGPEINQVRPTIDEMRAFLDKKPHYARSFWRNIKEVYGEEVAGEAYLVDLDKEGVSGDAVLPREQVPPFLRVAFYNSLKDATHEDAKTQRKEEGAQRETQNNF